MTRLGFESWNRSGSTADGSDDWLRTLTTARNDIEPAILLDGAHDLADTKRHPGQLQLALAGDNGLGGQVKVVGEYWEGAELVLGRLFDALGIPMRSSDLRLLRNLVIARVMNSVSKRRTASWLA